MGQPCCAPGRPGDEQKADPGECQQFDPNSDEPKHVSSSVTWWRACAGHAHAMLPLMTCKHLSFDANDSALSAGEPALRRVVFVSFQPAAEVDARLTQAADLLLGHRAGLVARPEIENNKIR
jgi:hypothetical protein